MATFDGNTSVVQYQQNLSDTSSLPTSLSFRFRTREQNANILNVFYGAGGGANVVSAFVSGSKLGVTVFEGTQTNLVSVPEEISDGYWHEVKVDIEEDSSTLIVTLDGNVSSVVLSSGFTVDIFNAGSVYLGGLPSGVGPSGSVPARPNFKGCIEEARVGTVLLPFFPETSLQNNTAKNRYVALAPSTDTILPGACVGDPVCSVHACQHGAGCVDLWNEYGCECMAGYTGRYCEVDIDECPGNLCENGATCVDGIASYTCNCVPGYTDNM